MKRLLSLLFVMILMTGCSGGASDMDHALQLRQKLMHSDGYAFTAAITADYTDEVHIFTMECTVDAAGNLSFEVKDPQTISGITGTITNDGGKLTFDDSVLAFLHLADGQLSPVSAPWVMMRSLRSGYLSACGRDGDYIKLSLDDSYHDDAMHLDIWLDAQSLPLRGEILWQGKRILSVDVRDFKFL